MFLSRFLKDRRGGVAPIFAFAIVPLVGLTGAAVDYSRANSVRAGMQSALDATALAMAKLAPTLTQAQLQQQSTAYFQALFNQPEAKSITITPTFTVSGGTQLTVGASGYIDTAFMNVLGISTMNVGSTSTVKWGTNRLRVALALDNTGSMASDGKMTALKTATKSLLTQLQTAATNSGDVYVSIIPFSKNVNVGPSNYNANWIDWEEWEDDNGHDQSTTTCSNKKTGKSGKPKKKCTTSTTWVPDNHNSWNGCVTDRDKSYDIKASAPSAGTASTLFPAEQYDNCPLPMMGLSHNWTDMTTLVNQMYPAGTTNQTIGLVWAWQSLVGGGPFTVPPMDPNYKYQQVIILMSDGLNTQNRWDGNGSSQSSDVDARMALACANVKDKETGITVYTIHVNTDGDPTSTVLRNCASETNKFFTVTSSSGIGTVFTQIGTQLSQLRISK